MTDPFAQPTKSEGKARQPGEDWKAYLPLGPPGTHRKGSEETHTVEEITGGLWSELVHRSRTTSLSDTELLNSHFSRRGLGKGVQERREWMEL